MLLAVLAREIPLTVASAVTILGVEIDWVDDFIARHRDAFAAGYDLETEAISERIVLLADLLKQRQKAVLAQYGLSWEEWDLAVRFSVIGPG